MSVCKKSMQTDWFIPCSKRDLCSAWALCSWNFFYVDEHGSTQTAICSSISHHSWTMPGKSRCSGHDVDDDDKDHDSFPQYMFISLNEEDRRQEFHKISKEEFRPDAGYGKQDSFIASGTHFTCPSWIIYWLLCPTDQNIEGASRLLGTGRLEPGFWPEGFRTSFLFPSSFFLCLLISFSHTILLHKV